MKPVVLVRVHDRMRDLELCLQVIRDTWKRRRWPVIVVSNGLARGIRVPESVRAAADEVVELEENPGHMGGNAQLLREGLRRVPGDATHVVLLEADTWLMDDALVERYARRLDAEDAVWASAAWHERWQSLAVDFAVVRADFLRAEPAVAEFTAHPESHVAGLIRSRGRRYLLISELMPVHIPKLMRRFWNPSGGRFREFPEGPMVTHHVEDLAGGHEEKMARANAAAGRRIFAIRTPDDPEAERRRIRRIRRLARLTPRSSWWRRRAPRPV